MTFPKARLAVSACLFLGWLVFLFVLWFNSSTVILAQPQFMIAQVYAVIEVRDENGTADAKVTVDEVLWSSDKADAQMKKSIVVADLPKCDKAHGYEGAGKYLAPLVKLPDGRFLIAPIPSVPGHVSDELRIYRWTPDVRSQVEKLVAAKK